jgi:transcriptional regulator with XRE-family HTH domain
VEEDKIYALLAERIRKERERSGLTREQLADAAGIATSFLAYLEDNKRKPSLPTIVRLAKVLKVPVPEFFANTPIKPANENHRLVEQFSHLIRGKTPSQKTAILNTLKTLAKNL